MVTVLTKDEELVKAEAEAWHKTHYRSEWFVSRTLGYGILVTTLAIYFFWDATRWSPSRNEMQIGSAVWIALSALCLMFFDFRERLSNETWSTVFRRIHKHLALSVATFLISVVAALAVHAVAAAIAGQLSPIQATAGAQAPIEQPIPSVTVTKTISKPPAKKVKSQVKPPASTAKSTTKPSAAKATTNEAPAKAKPAAKPKAAPAKQKPAAKKADPPARKVAAKKTLAKKKHSKKAHPAKKPKHHKKKPKRGGTLETSITTKRSQRFYRPEATAD